MSLCYTHKGTVFIIAEWYTFQQESGTLFNQYIQLLETLSKQFQNDAKATYFTGRYYFKVHAGKSRSDYGLQPHEKIPPDLQRKLLRENLNTMFHEYIHYIHEISTDMGNIMLGLDVTIKSIFSHRLDKDLLSSEHTGIDKTDNYFDTLCKIFSTKEIIGGSIEKDAKLLKIQAIGYTEQSIYFPIENTTKAYKILVPSLDMEIFEGNAHCHKQLDFGKFFLYEGLAYELDRELDRQARRAPIIDDNMKFTEYTVLRLLAEHILPDISKHVYLSIASFSLSYVNAGIVFIEMLKTFKSELGKGLEQDVILEVMRKEIREMLQSKIAYFNDAQDEIISVFNKRAQLFKAFTTICRDAKHTHQVRADCPDFEVEWVLSGQYKKLLETISLCDYLMVFNDPDPFNRDFLGRVAYTVEESEACKVLIAYDHYQKSHWLSSTREVERNGKHPCPFFSCCNLHLRQAHEHICAEKPWRIYEISSRTDRLYCWYGQAVGDLKGHTEK